MYEYTYIVKDDIDINSIQDKIKEVDTLLIFRLKNDFISQITIDKLLAGYENPNNIKIIDIQLDHSTKVLGDFHLERLPKFYFYKEGEIIHTSSGNISKDKLEKYISKLFLTNNS